MPELLQSIEASAFAAVLRTSFYAYPLVNAAHVLGAGGLVVLVWLMHGSLRSGDPFRARFFRRLVIVALIAMLLTGAALFSIKAGDYAANPAFRLKMALLTAALVNVAVYYLAGKARPAIRALAALASVILWPIILVAGRFIGFV